VLHYIDPKLHSLRSRTEYRHRYCLVYGRDIVCRNNREPMRCLQILLEYEVSTPVDNLVAFDTRYSFVKTIVNFAC